jgi:hypothetical protein
LKFISESVNAISEVSICKAFRLSGITNNFDVLAHVDTFNDKLKTIIEGDLEGGRNF